MVPAEPDGRLLAAVALGSRDALELLIGRHHAAVHRFAVRRIGADGHDVVIEAFEVARRRAGSYEPTTADARPWLPGIAADVLRRWRGV